MPPNVTVRDTYVAALQHDLVDLPADVTLVGVVRRPTPWFAAAVDENVPELGPPPDLLDAVKATQERLEDQGTTGAAAHNEAWAAVEFADRYREHLRDDPEARAAVDALRERLAAGEAIALVCYENTDEKRCHRTILGDRLERDQR